MNVIPVVGGVAVGNSGLGLSPTLAGQLDGNGNVQPRLGIQTGILLPLAQRTASAVSATQSNVAAKGCLVSLNVAAVSGTGGLSFGIQMQEPISGSWVNYGQWTSPVTTVGIKQILLYPGASGVTSVLLYSNSLPLPPVWRLGVSASDNTAYTYSASVYVF